MDMICIVLKKKLLYATSFAAVLKKKITDISFKVPTGPAQSSSIAFLKKRTVKKVASVLLC